MIQLLLPANGFVFDTHTELQNEFLRRIRTEGIEAALVWLEPVKDGNECSHPAVLTFTWQAEAETAPFRFELSEDPSFTIAQTAECTETSFCVENLKIGQSYFWRVNGGEVRHFITKGAFPRFIHIPDVLNVRDVGGISMKQGMVYRGSEMEFYPITDEGRRIFTQVLGIQTDLDLRAASVTDSLSGSAAGECVTLLKRPYRPYREIFEEVHRQEIVGIMALFADESRYPIYIHCAGGADRTGMIVLYLRAILGECDEELHRDYELTSLSTYAGYVNGTGFRCRHYDYYAAMLTALEAYAPGGTVGEQLRGFLLDCGVTSETMEKIATILRA